MNNGLCLLDILQVFGNQTVSLPPPQSSGLSLLNRFHFDKYLRSSQWKRSEQRQDQLSEALYLGHSLFTQGLLDRSDGLLWLDLFNMTLKIKSARIRLINKCEITLQNSADRKCCQ